ncbi:MAG: hypothetical protein KDB26_02885 [Microthrixaceae bacterium]|nr:hypothetical protein [Microthrixaceae bacterium]
MLQRISRQTRRRKTGGVLLATTALVSTVLVSATAGVSGAEPVSTKVPVVCVGADAKTQETLNLAKALIGTDKIYVDVNASAADIPTTAGIDDEINAQFKWAGTMDQGLIDKAAGLGLALKISNIKSSMSVRGPSSVDAFQATGTDSTIAPVAGQPAALNLGTIGGPLTTTGGGIVTYRVAGVTLTAALSFSGQNFVLNLTCSPTGSNLIAKTSVKDPNAPTFNPEVYKVNVAAGGTVSVDLLNDVIKAGKTPLMADSLKIVESPSAGTATLTDGVLTFTAPTAAGTYSTTVEICGEPNADSGIPGVNEVQKLQLGDNWSDGLLGPRPVGFTLKVGDKETDVIWTAQHILGPVLMPLPLNGVKPTSENWAPADSAGLVNDYLFGINYVAPTAGQVRSALEALPNIGAGNIEVTDLHENEANPGAVTGFAIKFVNDLAEQDVPQVELDDWFSVPPQEVLDRIGEAVAGIAGNIGGDDEGPANPIVTAADAARQAAHDAAIANGKSEDEAKAAGDEAARNKANEILGNRILESVTGGPAVSDEEWSGWAEVVIINPIMDSVPAIIAWINSLFPKKVILSTTVAGEAPIPPEPLCSQGIIDVTVEGAAALPSTETPNGNQPAVEGKNEDRGITFTG